MQISIFIDGVLSKSACHNQTNYQYLYHKEQTQAHFFIGQVNWWTEIKPTQANLIS